MYILWKFCNTLVTSEKLSSLPQGPVFFIENIFEKECQSSPKIQVCND